MMLAQSQLHKQVEILMNVIVPGSRPCCNWATDHVSSISRCHRNSGCVSIRQRMHVLARDMSMGLHINNKAQKLLHVYHGG